MKKLLITLLAVNCIGNLWSMEEIKKDWQIKVQETEKKLPILKVISLFCDDYIAKNKLKLDDTNSQDPVVQWRNKFDEFKHALVDIKPTWGEWKTKFWKEKNSGNNFALDGNSWILTYLGLKPFGDLDTVDESSFSDFDEVNFLKQQTPITKIVNVSEKPKSICLKKEVKPFFSFEFIQKTCPSSNEMIMGKYSISNIGEDYIKNVFAQRWAEDWYGYLLAKSVHFNVKTPIKISEMTKEVRREGKFHSIEPSMTFDQDKFLELGLKNQQEFVNYCYNLDAFFRGCMPNVFVLFKSTKDLIKVKEVRHQEKIDYGNDYPQVALISGVSYISYQKPYTILYGMLIQYAYIFLSARPDAYQKLLDSKIKQDYGSRVELDNFYQYFDFNRLSEVCNESSMSFDQLTKQYRQHKEKLNEEIKKQQRIDAQKNNKKKTDIEYVKNNGLLNFLNRLNTMRFITYLKQNQSIYAENDMIAEELKKELLQEFDSQHDFVNKLINADTKWREQQKQQENESPVNTTQPSWWNRQTSWLKSYIRPILVTAGVLGAGFTAYKMWQARTKKKVEEK